MPVTKEEIIKIAGLAKLSFTEKELEKLLQDMNKIIEYFDILNESDLPDCGSMVSKSGDNVFRKDEVKKSLTNNEAIENAPSESKGYFKVPEVIKG